ncbi:AraC-like DNA-binding protein [Pedobacter africanus]|uniref:AraC-like DNA-binding protein n=1 Tax=Pedobacter africanus TaxID=151894 RepID=A0ACC6KR74_9SPHI|nr:helix-turn-helix transcriptional regulator [Pedobacter africanus]MDR6781623.1 AraC-like DNA-binding protein [Pedobacter africanus]
MQSHIKLHLAPAEPLTLDALLLISSLPLKMAEARRIITDDGYLLIQSINHYIAHIELFEYNLIRDSKIDFVIERPSFFMQIVLGKNTCCMSYKPAGKYRRILPAGNDQVLLISFQTEWLSKKCHKLTEFKPFNEIFGTARYAAVNLPPFGIARNIFKSLKSLNLKTNEFNIDADVHVFVNKCFNKYYHKLSARNATSCYHQHKAQAIAAFIEENFATELVDDLPKLAQRFMVSERSMARLAKIAFGTPLREKVIDIRMCSSLEQLVTTNYPIYEIAKRSGYKEGHYFSKAFRKHYGVAPKYILRPHRRSACKLQG